MKSIKKTLAVSVLILAVFSILTRFLGFLFRIYLSRELGAELLGVYQVAFSVFMVLVIVVSSGLPLAVSKSIARGRAIKETNNEGAVVSSALITGLVIALVICAVILLLYPILGGLFSDDRCIYILISLLPAVVFSAVYSAFRGALWGQLDYFNVSLAELVEQVARIIVFALMAELIFTSLDGASLAGLSMSVACLISAVFVMIVYFRQGNKLKNPRGQFKSILNSATPVTGVRMASSLIQPIIAVLFPMMLVLAGYTSEQSMEAYGIAMGMTFPLLFLPSTITGALSFALIPDLSGSIARKENEKVAERIRSSLTFALFVSALFIPFFMGCGIAIGTFLFDNPSSGIYLSRAAWVMIPLGLSNITSSILNAFNLEVKSFINNIIGGGVLLVIVVLFSGAMGVDALILGFGACMSITTVLNLVMLKKKTQVGVALSKPAFLMAVFLLPSGLCANWVFGVFSILFGDFLGLAFAGVVSCVVFSVLCWLFKLIDITGLIVNFKSKKRKKPA